MSLKAFHIFFVTVSMLLMLLMGAWSLRQWQDAHSETDLALCIVGFAASVLLIAYGVWFLKKINRMERA